ncbi:hypothetical protein BJ912DRAFT_80090 [Pholiota molesta]|nr:hypothetical protein BJ912DRAFT_80090 [Pholiota molesta]
MYAFKTFVSLALPLLVVANPLVVRNDGNVCNSGALNCCDSTESSTVTGSSSGGLLGLLSGLGVRDLGDGLIGLKCSPILGANDCTQQTVCCTDNSFNGVVALGCTPVNINL